MNFPFYAVTENGSWARCSSSISSLAFRVAPMLVSISSNCYKTMPVTRIDLSRPLSLSLVLALAFYSIIIVVFFEAIAVSWLYGIDRISDDVHEMLGSRPGKFWIFTWCAAAPIFLGVTLSRPSRALSLFSLLARRVLSFPVSFNTSVRPTAS